jgi:hypothetical protein
MIGTIGRWEILSHPRTTIQCFGWKVFFRAIFSGPGRSFLAVLQEAGAFESTREPASEFLARCIELENRAGRIYQALAQRFRHRELAREFFENLAAQEQVHAELLELCRAVAGRGRWQSQPFASYHAMVPEVEKNLIEAEAALPEIGSLTEVLRKVIDLETAQINDLFSGAVRATDPRFPKKFVAFRGAIHDHFAYIRGQVPILAPELREACANLRYV